MNCLTQLRFHLSLILAAVMAPDASVLRELTVGGEIRPAMLRLVIDVGCVEVPAND